MVELREPLDELVAPPARFTSGTTFPRAKEIRLYDTTLRDGEQTPGVAFTPEQKYELAGMLSDAGVHIIDMGFPSAAPSERRALELILQGEEGAHRADLEVIVMAGPSRDSTSPSTPRKNMGVRRRLHLFIFPPARPPSSTRSARRCSSRGPRPDMLDIPVRLTEGQHQMACDASAMPEPG